VEIARDRQGTGPVVTGFAGRGYKVRDAVREMVVGGGLLLTPEVAREWQAPGYDAEALAPLLGLDPLPEFLLLGTGAVLEQPPRGFVAAIEARGIGVEAMDSRAAARAWGVLRAEGRWIVGALMPL
jgi:uncharacterized protein